MFQNKSNVPEQKGIDKEVHQKVKGSVNEKAQLQIMHNINGPMRLIKECSPDPAFYSCQHLAGLSYQCTLGPGALTKSSMWGTQDYSDGVPILALPPTKCNCAS